MVHAGTRQEVLARHYVSNWPVSRRRVGGVLGVRLVGVLRAWSISRRGQAERVRRSLATLEAPT